MQVHKYIPPFPLSEFIEHVVHVSGAIPTTHIKELPYGGINLVIELNENTVNTVFTENSFSNKYVS